MGTTRITQGGVLLLILVICLAACSRDDESNEKEFFHSVGNISFSGEGDSALISFPNENWEIAAVLLPDKFSPIWGDIYASDGKQVRSNTQLVLSGLGRLEAKWMDHGFVITRSSLNSLKIEALENSDEEDFSFVITLASGGKTKDILVEQGRSAGYSFERIEYTLIPESYKTVYKQNGRFTFNIQGETKPGVKYNPFQNHYNNYTFISDDHKAFVWTKDEALAVEIPGGVLDGKLFYNRDSIQYQNSTSKLPLRFPVAEVEIDMPVGESECHFELEYEEYHATYRIFAKNKTTGAEKVFEGTFISSCPNGIYQLVWDSENNPN